MHSFSECPVDHLNDEYQAMACLLKLIKQEQKYLIEADIENISKVTEEKTALIENITALTKVRHHALASEGLQPNDAGMQTWLDMTANQTANRTWTRMLEIAQVAKELNRTNGLLINQHLTRNRKALNVLQGNGESFYGPNGQATSKSSPRRLVIG